MSSANNIAIRVSNLSKLYKIYPKPADMFWELVKGTPRYKPFWALQNISFEVMQGQVMGIIGRNGAGKSTLLKIITGTLDKTAGEVVVNGRVSSILELGTGFNGEYTGRENIYLGGLMVGMSREEVKRKMDWIIEFSELQDFIDQPFKTYSTGMQARLTFSTAVCIDPDILIVDEALAVGDVKFQSKCFALMESFRKSGKTILLVSHALDSIKLFCDNAILLEHGEILKRGQAKEVADFYHKRLFSPEEKAKLQPISSVETARPSDSNIQADQTRPGVEEKTPFEDTLLKQQVIEKLRLNDIGASDWGSKKAEFLDFGILDEQGNQTTILETGRNYILFNRILFYEDMNDVFIGVIIRTPKGLDVFKLNSNRQKIDISPKHRGDILEVRVKVTAWLAPGDYFLSFGLATLIAEETEILDARFDMLHFNVVGDCLFEANTLVNLLPQWVLISH